MTQNQWLESQQDKAQNPRAHRTLVCWTRWQFPSFVKRNLCTLKLTIKLKIASLFKHFWRYNSYRNVCFFSEMAVQRSLSYQKWFNVNWNYWAFNKWERKRTKAKSQFQHLQGRKVLCGIKLITFTRKQGSKQTPCADINVWPERPFAPL